MTHAQVHEWMRDGRPDPAPTPITEHLVGCAQCRAMLDEADEVRGWFDEEPFALDPSAADAIRFRLEAATREPVERPRRAPLAVGGLVAAAAVVLLTVLSSPGPGASDKNVVAPLATVTAAPEVEVVRLQKPPHEHYRLVNGIAHFDVQPLDEGQRFVVVVGDDRVVVRGTAYQVTAAAGRLMAVRVTEGVVELELSEGARHTLHAGEAWERENEDARSATPGDLPEASPAAMVRPDVARPSFNELFDRAWSLREAGRDAAAAAAFDRLVRHPQRGAREAEVLFWSAQLHLVRGNQSRARARLETLLRRHPDFIRANEARRQLDALPGE